MSKKKKQSEAIKQLKGATWQSVVTGILFILLGVVLLINPEKVTRTIFHTIGTLLIVFGLIQLLMYFLSNVERRLKKNRFIIGSCIIIAGMFFIFGYSLIKNIVPYIMGGFIFVNGIIKLQTAMNVMKLKGNKGGMLVLIAILTILLGIAILIMANTITNLILRIVGAAMIFTGVTEMVNMFYMSRGLKNYLEDMEALVQDPKD
ncbi:MAG: DUF308 domain-containing protein [Lachnospiraceae bacterium]|nr:DUF308 domain-containing protein [Lachnospiraceae bacterium]